MSEPSVKCRHCGEVILIVCGENFYRHAERLMIRCSDGGNSAEPPIRTVLSAEDRERLNIVLWHLSTAPQSAEITDATENVKAVLANAGGGE